jgi:hypothetical protein
MAFNKKTFVDTTYNLLRANKTEGVRVSKSSDGSTVHIAVYIPRTEYSASIKLEWDTWSKVGIIEATVEYLTESSQDYAEESVDLYNIYSEQRLATELFILQKMLHERGNLMQSPVHSRRNPSSQKHGDQMIHKSKIRNYRSRLTQGITRAQSQGNSDLVTDLFERLRQLDDATSAVKVAERNLNFWKKEAMEARLSGDKERLSDCMEEYRSDSDILMFANVHLSEILSTPIPSGGRRKNPSSSSLGAIAVAGIAGFLLSKSK